MKVGVTMAAHVERATRRQVFNKAENFLAPVSGLLIIYFWEVSHYV
jgi:hypothetical protein